MTIGMEKGKIVVAVMSNKSYSEKIVSLAKQACDTCSALIYVSLNKPYDPLNASLKKGKVRLDNILFIDGISASAGQKVEAKNCICVQSAGALTQISIVISKAMKAGKFDGLLFDSLSTLLIYNKKDVVVKFVQSMVNKLRKAKYGAVFTILEGDADKGLLNEVGLFVDEVIKFE